MDTGRSFTPRIAVIGRAGLFLATLTLDFAIPRARSKATPGSAGAPRLTISITLENPTITEPFPARLTLHLHNAGATPLWLYRHARDPMEIAEAQSRLAAETEDKVSTATTGGSSLVIHFEPAVSAGASTGPAPSPAEPAHGRVLASVGMPHPLLVRLSPGGDDEERAVIDLSPELVTHAGGEEPVWGHYRLAVSYTAQYSNGDALARDLGVDIWQGEATSNILDVDLQPAPAPAAASLSGRVTRESGQPLYGALVSLSDHGDHLVTQMVTDQTGQFSFDRLPWGLYWVTARRRGASHETAVYDHAELRPDTPTANINLVMLEPETYEPKQLLHKPVLLRVTSAAGQSLAGVGLEVLWSTGTVADNVKGQTGDDGAVALNLLPGRNYVTLKGRKCPSEERWVDVAEGDGIDGFKLALDCQPR
jgi:hypothetical protein